METEAYDRVYETKDGWTEVPAKSGERCRFSVREVDGRKLYFTEVVTPLPGATVEALQAAFTGAWSWWRHGKYRLDQKNPDGSMDFTFWPSPTPVVKLLCAMAPPKALPDGGTRLFCAMRGTADGAYYFDIRRTPEGASLTSRQLGVPRGLIPALMGMESFARTHILSELGEFSFPLPKGSGFVGLKEQLKAPPPA